MYAYVSNSPINFIDPMGLEMRVQWHAVAGNNYHTFITITPENQGRYAKDPRFSNVDSKGRRYATIGAGPEGGLLVSNVNRENDRRPHQGGNIIKSCESEDTYIDKLFAYDANYGDNLDYDLFPQSDPNRRSWYLADDGYNSNSFVNGLIRATGGTVTRPAVNIPGWDRPVPSNNFAPPKAKR